MSEMLDRLKAAAIEGQLDIERGNPFRDQLPDAVFTQLVPEDREDEVIEEMVHSNEWWRSCQGFNLREWYDELR